jgi:hypothetical protein
MTSSRASLRECWSNALSTVSPLNTRRNLSVVGLSWEIRSYHIRDCRASSIYGFTMNNTPLLARNDVVKFS